MDKNYICPYALNAIEEYILSKTNSMSYLYDREIEEINVGTNEVTNGYVTDGSATPSSRPIVFPDDEPKNWFYVEDISGSNNTLSIIKTNSSAPTLTIEKSNDGTTWSSIGDTSTTAITTIIPSNSKLYLRTSANRWSSTSSNYNYITCSNNFNVGGNIMSLLYGSNFTGSETTFPSSSSYAFVSLFRNNTKLYNASNLVLPVTSMSYGGYYSMFYGCTSLVTAPELPATTLAEYCYSGMFRGCTSLTVAPELHGRAMKERSCSGMFYDCTSLTTPPVLPATTLATYCYENMFYGCSSLTTAPALPATTLAEYCYTYMFRNCTSLTTAPALPATTLKNYCYEYMFYNCSSLRTAPSLPGTNLAYDCYSFMFYGCISLTTAPALPATILKSGCYSYMFQNCSSLTTAPELPATTLVSECYYYMFYNCRNLKNVTCLATNISAYNCTYYWLYGVSSTGTFTTPSSTAWTTGISGIPSGWTIQYT